MDDTFTFRADRMPRRTIDPLALKAAVVAGLIVFVTGWFAKIVIDSEQRSLAHAAPATEARVGTISGVDAPEVPRLGESDVAAAIAVDDQARIAADDALAAARHVFDRDGSFVAAGPADLADLDLGLTFVDGPSTAPQIVSLVAAPGVWSAAVRSETGTCLYVRVTAQGLVTYGTGPVCTGDAAMVASAPSWDEI
jgi:hypothetical protein